MEEIVKKELKTTSKKAAASFAPRAFVAVLFCCGGPIVLLILISGGVTGILGFLTSSLFLILLGVLVFFSAIFWFLKKFTQDKNRQDKLPV